MSSALVDLFSFRLYKSLFEEASSWCCLMVSSRKSSKNVVTRLFLVGKCKCDHHRSLDKDIFMLVSEQEEVIMICLARKDKGGLLTDLSMLCNERFRVEISIIGYSSRIEMMVINVWCWWLSTVSRPKPTSQPSKNGRMQCRKKEKLF